jgi:hypothetical protein
MRKCAYLDLRRGNGWPRPEELEPYFLSPPGQCWDFESGNDNAGLAAEGVDGTEDPDPNDGYIDVDLDMWGHPDRGVFLIYSKWGGGVKEMCSSKGDLRRLREWVRSKRGARCCRLGCSSLMELPGRPSRNSWKQTASFQPALNGLPTAIFHGVHFPIAQPPQLLQNAIVVIRTGP